MSTRSIWDHEIYIIKEIYMRSIEIYMKMKSSVDSIEFKNSVVTDLLPWSAKWSINSVRYWDWSKLYLKS